MKYCQHTNLFQLEERRNIESQNKAIISDELERARMDIETEKIEIQHRAAGGKKYSSKEGADLEIQIAELKGDKSVVAMQVGSIKQNTLTQNSELCQSQMMSLVNLFEN